MKRPSCMIMVGALAGCASGPKLDTPPLAVQAADVETSAPRPRPNTTSSAVDALAHARNPMFTAMASDNPPYPYQPRPETDYRRLFELPGATIVAYNVGYIGGDAAPSSECEGIIAPDGALCPTVSLPGKVLDDEQRRRLRGAVDRALAEGSARSYAGCDFDPRFGFVVRDLSGYRGAILIATACAQIAIEDGPDAVSLSNELDFQQLCAELGLAGCVRADREAIAVSRAARDRNSPVEELLDLGAESHPEWLDLPLRRLPDPAKRGLCAWHKIHTSPRGAERYDCGARGVVRIASFDECVAHFPTDCGLSVRELSSCAAALSADVCAPVGQPCDGPDRCLWQTLR